MGNAALEGMKANTDKRESRLRNRKSFKAAIDNWLTATTYPSVSKLSSNEKVKVYVRKRPPFEKELQRDFDVVHCNAPSSQVTIFKCLMHADLKQMKMVPYQFDCDGVFDTPDHPEEVYDGAVKPLVMHAINGGLSTAFMFGATGSGKTYTMSAILKRSAMDLDQFCRQSEDDLVVSLRYFEICGSKAIDLLNRDNRIKLLQGADGNVHCVGATVKYCESAADILDAMEVANSQRKTAENGVHSSSSRSHAVCDLRLVPVSSRISQEECVIQAEYAAHYPSKAGNVEPLTPDDPQSNSSVEQNVMALDENNMNIQREGIVDMSMNSTCEQSTTSEQETKGSLLLIDLAGSERNKDSLHLTSSTRRQETIQINKSLMALKDCAKASTIPGSHVPYRASKLTHLLKSSFVNENAKTAIIGTVAPGSTDTEHTLSTVANVCLMAKQPTAGKPSTTIVPETSATVESYLNAGLETVQVPNVESITQTKAYVDAQRSNPLRWNAEQLSEWWSNAPSTADFPSLPASATGSALSRWSQARFSMHCGGDEAGTKAMKAWKAEIASFKAIRQQLVKDKLKAKRS